MTRSRWMVVAVLCLAVISGVMAFERSEASAPTIKNTATQAVLASTPNANAGSASMPQVLREAPVPAPLSPPQSPRVITAEAETDLFAAKSWYIAPPPPPPPKPEAPPFPYGFAGTLLDGDAVTLFVSLGERNYILHQGDQIDSNYRLDEIKDGVAVFTYLPLQQQQTLQIGTNK